MTVRIAFATEANSTATRNLTATQGRNLLAAAAGPTVAGREGKISKAFTEAIDFGENAKSRGRRPDS